MRLADAARLGALYPDRHLNVFVPLESHRLDLNVTRALISTLRWSRPELTRAFLSEVVGVQDPGPGGFQFDLGACDYEDFDPARCARQVVLGISRDGAVAAELPSLDDLDQEGLQVILGSALAPQAMLAEVRKAIGRPELSFDALETLAHTLRELERGSLPDGWILSDAGAAGVCVLFEAKLMRWLDAYQLQRYAEVWYGRRPRSEELVLRTWEQVGRFFALRREDPDPRTAFLCGQLHDYLDLLGLGAFHGFRPYDFDREALGDALPKFLGFARQARERAVERGLGLGAVRPSPTGARLPFADGAVPGELALDLTGDGVRVELRLGDALEGRLAGRAALDAVLQATQDGERNPLAGAAAPATPLVVRVERHRSPDPAAPGWLERETLSTPFDPAELPFVLSEVRRQHPAAGEARDSTGLCRSAVLALGQVIDRHQAVGDGEGGPLVERTVSLLGELARLARSLGGRADAS